MTSVNTNPAKPKMKKFSQYVANVGVLSKTCDNKLNRVLNKTCDYKLSRVLILTCGSKEQPVGELGQSVSAMEHFTE